MAKVSENINICPVQALALQGAEIALGYALLIRHTLLTFLRCLHLFAVAILILAVASPTEYYSFRQYYISCLILNQAFWEIFF